MNRFLREAGRDLHAEIATLTAERDVLREALNGVRPLPSEADMAAFGALEVACYKYPDDTPEHRLARQAYCDGAADQAKVQSAQISSLPEDVKAIAGRQEIRNGNFPPEPFEGHSALLARPASKKTKSDVQYLLSYINDVIRACAEAVRHAQLPANYQWGREATGHFEQGKEFCEQAILSLSPTSIKSEEEIRRDEREKTARGIGAR